MDIKKRTEYTQGVFSTFVKFFVMFGGGVLLLNVLHWPPYLHRLLSSIGVALVSSWIIAGILGCVLLLIEYFHRKEEANEKISFLRLFPLFFLGAFLIIPFGGFVAIPFAVYNAVKYKIPLKIEFRNNRRARNCKHIK